MSSAATDASTDVIVGSDEVSLMFVTDAGLASDEGAGEEPDAPLRPGCPACPVSPPKVGAPCDDFGLQELDCEYGDDPRLINVLAQCLTGQWYYGTLGTPLVEAGLPIGDAGCPATYAEALTASSCDMPSCTYPEGTCTCYLGAGANSGTGWSCLMPPLPAGCPSTVTVAQSSTVCPSSALQLLQCYYPGGTCICYGNDAGSPWRCTVPEAGCPATRPRLGSPCDPAIVKECKYIPIGCSSPTGDMLCVSTPCGGVWSGLPGALCR
jgi:hypothetical protein